MVSRRRWARVARALAAVAALAGAAACAGKTTVAANDANDTRAGGAPPVAAAMESLTAIAGHPIGFLLDPKIVSSRSRSEVDEMLARVARAVGNDLATLRRDEPAVFVRQVPRLARIEFRYGDGGAHDVTWEGTSLVLTRRYKWDVLGSGDLAKALRDDLYESLERRFHGAAPEQVAPADRADYFVYVRGPAPRSGRTAPPEPALERVLRLASLVGTTDPTLAADLRAWLFAQAGDIADTTRPEGQTPEARRAHAAWVAWLDTALPPASPSEKLKIARAVFGQGTVYGFGYRQVDNELEGFDSLAFGLRVADTWIAAGHPTTQAPGDPAFDLVNLVVCPPYYEHDGQLSRGDGQHSPWVRRAFATDAQMRRLTDALAARNDPGLLAAVLYNLPRIEQVPVRANFLRDLERHPKVWQLAMLRLIAEARSDGCDQGLVDEANRVWHDVPALRGTALHVIACKELHWRGVSDDFFKRFPRLYGESIGAPLFGSFLDDGPDAMKDADALWPAMSKGWSRVDAIVPRLDAFLTDPKVRAGDNGEPMRTLQALGKRLCEDGNAAQVAHFHQALVSRARADAAQGRALAKVLEDTQPGRCPHKR